MANFENQLKDVYFAIIDNKQEKAKRKYTGVIGKYNSLSNEDKSKYYDRLTKLHSFLSK